jgi:hypothetical protein
MKTRKMLLIFAAIMVTGLAGCKDKIIEITSIEVSPTSVNLVIGGTPNTMQLTAKALPDNASKVNFSWSSGDKDVATVDQSGLVTATGVGHTKITVSGEGHIVRIDVSVDEYINPVAFISKSDTWVSVDALGREIGTQEIYGTPKNRTVGVFYFIWLGAHGYDNHEDHETVQNPAGSTKSPYNISQMLRDNPANPQYGPVGAFHHWSEPHFGFYVSNDEWVIEKHIQLLADAGVDVLILDNTNAFTYQENIAAICRVMARMKEQGRATLKICSILNGGMPGALQRLYDGIYSKGLYREFWFEWKGKPLVLCPPTGLSTTLLNFFTIRHSWFDSRGSWFGNGQDKWTWADYYPQGIGWHDSPSKPEQMSIAVATHPTSNIGRSYSNGRQPATPRSGEGLFFAEQWKRALATDPEFIFITGWNEWVAMRFTDGAAGSMIGKRISKGDTYFVDQYNEEYSRDIEPMRGGFGDNFYYQMVDGIRRFKGVSTLPADTVQLTATIDGNPYEWKGTVYYDDIGDITSRNHFGWGKIGQLTNNSGRNDFVTAQAATDNNNAYFLMRTDQPIELTTDVPVQLFIATQGSNAWEGFHYLVNILPGNKAELNACQGDWKWQKVADVTCAVKDKCIELSIPLQRLGITSGAPAFDFKWADNMPQNGDIRDFMDNGDTAPNARFRYRYVFKKDN